MDRKSIVASLIVGVALMMAAAPAAAMDAGQYAGGAGAKLGRGVMQPATVFDWPTHQAYARTGSQSSSQ